MTAWLSANGELKVAVIGARYHAKIRLWRWSDIAGDWLHVTDVSSPIELAKFTDLSQLEELPSVPDFIPQ